MRLRPVERWPELAAPERDAALAAGLDLVRAWCREAIARAWDTGRLSATADGLPFAREVAGLLDGNGGLAPDELARARDRARAAEESHRATYRPVATAAAAARSPLGRLAHELSLSELAADILLVVAAPQLAGELARAYAILAADDARPPIDELLVGEILGTDRASARDLARELAEDAPLRRHGLIEMGPGQRPFTPLTCPPVVVGLLRQDEPAGVDTPAVKPLAELHLAPDSRAALARALAGDGGELRLVVRGRLGSGRRSVLAAVAAEAGLRGAVVEVGPWLRDPAGLRGVLRDVTLRGFLPCLVGVERLDAADPLQAEAFRAVCRLHPGPLGFRVGRGRPPQLDPGFDLVDVEPLALEGRTASWRAALGANGLDEEAAATLAGRFFFGPGIVAEVCRSAAAQEGAVLNIDEAIRAVRGAQIGDVAERVTRLATWDGVVLPQDTFDSLGEMIARVRHREIVFSQWGFDKVVTSGRGLTALFQGGPGTGKSMVAGALARELRIDLYHVEATRVASRWSGDTAAQIDALLDAAEDGDAIVLFEDADALFGLRPHPAALSIARRLDGFEGIAIFTTSGALDAAFVRRLTTRLTFPFPDAEARERLWEAHLPAELPRDGNLNLAQLAERFELAGGYIRNAALRAAFLAARDGATLTFDHLERAVTTEYREMGKLSPSGRLE